MTFAPVSTPDGALSRATSSPHAKTAPAVDLLPGSGRHPYTATERFQPDPRTKGRQNTRVLRGRARSRPASAGGIIAAQELDFVTVSGGGEGCCKRPADPPPEPDVLPLSRLDIALPRVLYLHSVVDLARSLVGHRSSVSSPLVKALKPVSDLASQRLAQELLHDPQTEFENCANDQR